MHPSREHLQGLAYGTLAEDEAEDIVEHVEQCPQCEETIRSLEAKPDTYIASLRTPPSPDPYSQESDCQRLVQMIEQVGQEPTTASQKVAAGSAAAASFGKLGQYRLLAKLGEGGMGAVYKALHTRLEKVVAVKVLPADRLQDAAALARFDREMKAVGRLEHTNIVRAMDAGEADGMHFLVMEYVEGTDLSQLVKQLGPLPIADACELIRQAAIGLEEARKHGMVHRDIKPGNLMLSRRGEVKVLDLGLALLSAAHTGERRELTATGQMMGTLDYMAPEQGGDSHVVDIRADVYSLGATLYKLLTGEVIYHGARHQTPVQKVVALATQPAPPIQSLRGEIPSELAAVVHHMLEKEPAQRFATPDEVACALAPFCKGANLTKLIESAGGDAAATYDASHAPTQSSLPVLEMDAEQPPVRPHIVVQPAKKTAAGRSNLPPWLPLAIGGGVLGLGGLAVLLAAMVFYIQTPTGTLRVEINDPSVEVSVKGSDVVLKQADKEEITLTSGEHSLVVKRGDFSFETNTFVLRKGEMVTVKVELLPGKVQVVSGDKVIGSTKINDNGPAANESVIASFTAENPTIDRDGVTKEAGGWKIVARGDRTARLFELSKPGVDNCFVVYRAKVKAQDIGKQAYLEMWCRFAESEETPAGEYFSKGFNNAAKGTSDWATYEIPFRLEKGQTPDLIKLNVVVEGGGTVWIKDVELVKQTWPGSTVAVDSPESSSSIPDQVTVVVPAKPVLVLRSTLSGHANAVWAAAFSPDGQTLATGGLDNTVILWNVCDEKQRRTLRGHGNMIRGVAFSPDGKSLATASKDTTLKMWDAKTGDEKQTLRGHSNIVTGVAWSPDGATILSSSDDRTARLWDAAKATTKSTLKTHIYWVTSVAFSADKKLAATGAWDHTVKLWDAATGEEIRTLAADAPVHAVAFSLDSRSIVAGCFGGGVRCWDTAGGEQRWHFNVPVGASGVAFHPGGEMVAVADGKDGVHLLDAATGKQLAIGKEHAGIVRAVAFSPDGATLASGGDDNSVKLWDVTGVPLPATPLSAASTPDYDRFAKGKWVRALDAVDKIPKMAGVSFNEGVITLDDAMFRDNSAEAVEATDMIVRAQVKGWASLATRCTGGNYTFWLGDGYLGINRNDSTGQPTVLASRAFKVDAGEFHELALATVGGRQIAFVDGRRVLDTTDDKWPVRGPILIHAHQTKSQFKEIEVMSLDGLKVLDLLPERDPLAKWVGMWDTQWTHTVAGRPAVTKKGHMVVAHTKLADFYSATSSADDGSSSLFIYKFQPESNTIRTWTFFSDGRFDVFDKQIDPATGDHIAPPRPRDGGVETGTIHMSDKDTSEVRFVTKSPDGKVLAESVGVQKRRDERAPGIRPSIRAEGPAKEIPQLAVLAPFAGRWGVEMTVKPSQYAPDGAREVMKDEIYWALGGRFMIGQGHSADGKLTGVWLWGYDPQTKTYPMTMFQDSGDVPTWNNVWDPKKLSLEGIAKGLPEGWAGIGGNRLVDENTTEVWVTMKNERGEVLYDMTATKRREASPTQRPIPPSDEKEKH